MSALDQILDAIVAKHQAVPQIGKVHDRERYDGSDDDKFRELYAFKPTGAKESQIRGWWWERVATVEKSVSTATTMNVHTWRCRGYMSFVDKDASSRTFQNLIEAFRDAVRADPTLGGVCDQNSMEGEPDGVQVVDVGPVSFCGVLCHSAVLQLKTWSYP